MVGASQQCAKQLESIPSRSTSNTWLGVFEIDSSPPIKVFQIAEAFLPTPIQFLSKVEISKTTHTYKVYMQIKSLFALTFKIESFEYIFLCKV